MERDYTVGIREPQDQGANTVDQTAIMDAQGHFWGATLWGGQAGAMTGGVAGKLFPDLNCEAESHWVSVSCALEIMVCDLRALLRSSLQPLPSGI